MPKRLIFNIVIPLTHKALASPSRDPLTREFAENLKNFTSKIRSNITKETLKRCRTHDLVFLVNFLDLTREGKFKIKITII